MNSCREIDLNIIGCWLAEITIYTNEMNVSYFACSCQYDSN